MDCAGRGSFETLGRDSSFFPLHGHKELNDNL